MDKEYIGREEALKLREVFSDRKNGNKDFLDGIETAIEFVQNLPAADVVEIRHGRWINKEVDEIMCHVYGNCSVCHERKRIDNFCSHCGTKMDKEE